MNNRYLFLRRQLTVLVFAALVLVGWAIVNGPVLSLVAGVIDAPAATSGEFGAVRAIRFAAGWLVLAAIPLLTYLGWVTLMGPDGTRGVGPRARSLVLWAAIFTPMGFALALSVNLGRAPSFLSTWESLRFACRLVALDVLDSGGEVVGDAFVGAAVVTGILLVLGVSYVCVAPVRQRAAWWRLAALPAGVVGLWVGMLPHLG